MGKLKKTGFRPSLFVVFQAQGAFIIDPSGLSTCQSGRPTPYAQANLDLPVHRGYARPPSG
jgi:hypothetical protein